MINLDLTAIVLGLITTGGILAKYVDYRIKRMEKRDEERNIAEKQRYNAVSAEIIGRLYDIRSSLSAGRVYILQPHPLHDHKYISMSYELVDIDNDVKSYTEAFQNLSMTEWAGMVKKFNDNDWIVYRDINVIEDNKWRNDLKRRAVKCVVYRRMYNAANYWIGTVCVEFIDKYPSEYSVDWMKDIINSRASMIYDILPEYNP